MDEDWIGEVGTLTFGQPDGDRWHRVEFEREVADPVVVARPQTAHGAHPYTVAIRGLDATGFEIQLDEWEYLDGAHTAETIAWVAVSEGRHELSDGRVIEAGRAALATPGGLRFAEIEFAEDFGEAPAVLAQTLSETNGATATRLRAVEGTGFEVSLQQEEAATGAVAASLGWIAVSDAAALEDVTHLSTPAPSEAEVLLAEMQTTNGRDTATTLLDRAAGEVRLVEEGSADQEIRHIGETVALVPFHLGGLGVPAAEAPAGEGLVERWSDPATWGGALPGPGDVVVIEEGRTVLLDADAEVAGVMVHGTLLVEDGRDLALETGWLMAMCGGEFQVGSEDDPHASRFTLTLTGDPDDPAKIDAAHGAHGEPCPVTGGTCRCAGAEMDAAASGALMAMGAGSTIEIWGADAAKTDWTRLAETAEAGAREIVLEADAGWRAGDRIVLASTDFDMHQAETATILEVSADGRRLTLDRALEVMHFGALQSYAEGRVLDTRAEVGLLSRNIVIRGDADAHLDGFGGHTMVMAGAELRISGVEFFRMGQEGALGRYPVHWHLAGDAAGQWVTDSAFHESYNRAVTVHGTHNVTVADNVAYDTIGHTYFLEDGTETGNRFLRNLGLVTHAADPATAVTPTDATHVATFWITNPDNVFVDNAAAGSDHGGFWIAPGPGADRLPLGRFEGNVAHSNGFANLAIDGHADPETGVFVESEYHPAGDAVIRDFTSYKSADRAIWVRAAGIEFHEIQSADNARATFFSYNQVMHDSLVVGRSANIGTPETPVEIAQGRSLPDPYNGRYFRGHSIYDGPSGVVDTHFAGFTDLDAAFQTNGAAQKSTAHVVSGLSFEDVSARGRVDFAPERWEGHMWSSGLLDLDGTLTGQPGARVMPILVDAEGRESRLHIPDTAARREVWGAWLVEGDVGLLQAHTDVAPGQSEVVRWSRSDGAEVADAGTFGTYHQTSVALNGPHTYRLAYPEIPGALTLSLRFAEAGDVVLVELPGMPSEATVVGAEEVASRAELMAAEGTAVLREGTTVVLRLVADEEEADPRFRAAIGHPADHRFVAGVTVLTGRPGAPMVADFEAPDPRLSASGTGMAAAAPVPAWEDQADSIVFWDATAEGPAGGRAELRLDLGGQDWSGHDRLEVRAATQALGQGAAAGFRLWLEDAETGRTDLGHFTGTAAVDLAALAPEARDAVDALVFEVSEAAVAPEGQAGDGQRLLLWDATLAAGFEARPVAFPQLVPAGSTFGIVGAALTGAQRGEGPVAIVAVSDPVGGQVRLGTGDQAGNVFFTAGAEPGPASFAVTYRDGAGRTATGRAMVEVVA